MTCDEGEPGASVSGIPDSGPVGTGFAVKAIVNPRDEPQAAPADSAADAGSFGRPDETMQVGVEPESGPETNQDPAPVKDLRPGASLWIAVVVVLIAIGAALYGYFWAVSGA